MFISTVQICHLTKHISPLILKTLKKTNLYIKGSATEESANSRGRRERYASKFGKFGYRWVPSTRQILEIGYRWIPGTEQILEVGYRVTSRF